MQIFTHIIFNLFLVRYCTYQLFFLPLHKKQLTIKNYKIMTIKDVIAVVEGSGYKKFKVITNVLKTEYKRLFVSANGVLCEYKKGSKRYGYPLHEFDVCNWSNVTPYFVDDLTKVKNFMTKIVNYLNKSGLWTNIKKDYEVILAQGDDFLIDLLNSDYTDRRDKLHKLALSLGLESLSLHCDEIIYSAKKGIKNVNYNKYEKEIVKQIVKDAINNCKRTQHKWRKGYDNSIEIAMHNDVLCGWYCEEYKNCGNGHYYLLLDECHAFFYEHD